MSKMTMLLRCRKLWRAALLLLLVSYFPPLTSTAQSRFVRYDCLSPATEADGPAHAPSPAPQRLRPLTEWDSTRTYPVAVVLVSFADCDFTTVEPAAFYERLFNEEGFNNGRGPGCVADYFRDQSRGLFRPQFDIIGPVQMAGSCVTGERYGSSTFREATQLLADSLGVDFSPYDWDGDGSVEAIIFIYAGSGGNETANDGKGYIWPSTGGFATLTVGGLRLSAFSASAELWSSGASCGIGTICHEYSHTLGLPDLYPTAGDEYSVVDEWDLMDGGNFVNSGWCPPAYSAHERMLLGWLQPLTLDEAATIDSLRPVADGGTAYLISTDAESEFFLLENRQWSGWDMRTPGHGLLIAHVDYDELAWANNRVNRYPDHHRYDLVHADNMSYDDWTDWLGDAPTYQGGRSLLLSGTPYPLLNDSISNDALTDTSTPAATTYGGTGLLSKPITDIEEHADGSVSFRFMGGDPSGVSSVRRRQAAGARTIDLLGRQGATRSRLVVHNGKKQLTNNQHSHYESHH